MLERLKLFSKVAGAGVFKTRYGLIAFIDVVLLLSSAETRVMNSNNYHL